MPASRDKIPVPLPSSNINHPCPSPRMNKKNRPGTHPNYDMGMDRDAIRSLSAPPTPCILTRKTVFLEVGRVVDGLWCLSRCPQALPFALPSVFRPLAFSLLARFSRSSTLTKSLEQANSPQNCKNSAELAGVIACERRLISGRRFSSHET